MNTGHLKSIRAEQEAKKAQQADILRFAGNTTITNEQEEQVAELVNQDDVTVAYVSTGLDRHMDLEIIKHYNAFPKLVEELEALVEYIQWRDEETHDEDEGPMANASAKALLDSLK